MNAQGIHRAVAEAYVAKYVEAVRLGKSQADAREDATAEAERVEREARGRLTASAT